MYPAKPGLLIGFHGCEETVRDDVIAGVRTLNPSQNKYDWLGNGIYFWENNYARALEAHDKFVQSAKVLGREIPINKLIGNSNELLIRNLDCAVIESLHHQRTLEDLRPFDSARGVFTEGKELYPGAGFRDKNHIQICIRNPNCIKGYFLPRKETRWPMAS